MNTDKNVSARQEKPTDKEISKIVESVRESEQMFSVAGNRHAFQSGKSLLRLLPVGRSYVQGVSINSILEEITDEVNSLGVVVSKNTLQKRRAVEIAFPESFRETLEGDQIAWSIFDTLTAFYNYEGKSEICREWIKENAKALSVPVSGRELARETVRQRNPKVVTTTVKSSKPSDKKSDKKTEDLGLVDRKVLASLQVICDVITGDCQVGPETFATVVETLRQELSNIPDKVDDSVMADLFSG